ncbi:MAG: hypothetical protein J0H43_14845, partial [Actinobacteria bacterium]|nr:hypothetical protein [Actinomycetota bacterium]
MRGVKAWWAVRLDQAEVERRGLIELQCLSRLDLLHVLLGLPLGQAVEESDLRPRERRSLAGLSHPVVEWTSAGVVRLARPSIAVEHAYIVARTFEHGLDRASRFGAYCTRSIVLPATLTVLDIELAEASFHGIGVYRTSRRGRAELVAPEPLPQLAETA